MELAINKSFRIQGYRDALAHAGIPFRKELLIEARDGNYQAGYRLRHRLVQQQATAAMVSNDELAAGVVNSLTDHGIQVPDQFEVVTSNDTKLTEITRPSLSSITQPLYDIGAVAMRMLTKLMDNEQLTTNNVLLSFGLKARQSTKSREV